MSNQEYKIELTIDKDVIEDIKTNLGFKRIAGDLYGILDEFIFLIVASIEDGKESIHICNKEKIKEDNI